MTKGVMSPWAMKSGETPQEKAERVLEEVHEGMPRREMTFDGRAFQIVVAFFSLDREPEKLSTYAHDALGRVIQSALTVDKTLSQEFERQSITLDSNKMLSPKVTVPLGPITLYVKASSFEPKMAKLMAIDRIALALSDAKGRSAKIKTCLEDHDAAVVRKA